MSDEQKVAATEGSKEEATSSNKTQRRGPWHAQVLVMCFINKLVVERMKSRSLPSIVAWNSHKWLNNEGFRHGESSSLWFVCQTPPSNDHKFSKRSELLFSFCGSKCYRFNLYKMTIVCFRIGIRMERTGYWMYDQDAETLISFIQFCNALISYRQNVCFILVISMLVEGTEVIILVLFLQ